MENFIAILGLIFLVKCFLFWLWLWQLKEYHWGRFKAHFETQAIKKITSSFWSFKLPKFTKKTVIISFLGALLISYSIFSLPTKNFYLILLLLIFFNPLIFSLFILFFQIPTVILRKRILKKARQKREKFKNLLVIGITGSYGKTSTKEFLATILAEKYKVLKTKEHQNSEMGISQSILNDLKKEHEIFIVEMGAYNKGGIKLLCDIAQPKIGIITGVNEQHLATFGTMENLISAEGGKELIESISKNKSKIFLRGLPIETMAFFNANNQYCLATYQKIKNVKKFLYGQTVKIAGLENIKGAKSVAKELGLTEKEIEKACQKIENKFPGIEIKKGINNLIIIDATYSANPNGVLAHLEYLTTQFPQGKKIIVMPCLIELGKASKSIHRKIGKKIAQSCNLAIITTKDRFKEIKDGSTSVSQKNTEVLFMNKTKNILKKIKNFGENNDFVIVLLESRVPSKIIEQLIVIN